MAMITAGAEWVSELTQLSILAELVSADRKLIRSLFQPTLNPLLRAQKKNRCR
jgi:hypothetical protein